MAANEAEHKNMHYP